MRYWTECRHGRVTCEEVLGRRPAAFTYRPALACTISAEQQSLPCPPGLPTVMGDPRPGALPDLGRLPVSA